MPVKHNFSALDMATSIFGVFIGVWWANLFAAVFQVRDASISYGQVISPFSVKVLLLLATSVWIGIFVYLLILLKFDLVNSQVRINSLRQLSRLSDVFLQSCMLLVLLALYLIFVNYMVKQPALPLLSIGLLLLFGAWLITDFALLMSIQPRLISFTRKPGGSRW